MRETRREWKRVEREGIKGEGVVGRGGRRRVWVNA